MTIELSLLLSGVSVAFAVFFGLSTRNRNTKKDTQEEAREEAAVMVKLDALQASMIELKAEVKGYREEVRVLSAQAVRNEESLKSLHKRVDAMERMLRMPGRNNDG
jgi:uncharacterized protein YlxW (UPF0749 family)